MASKKASSDVILEAAFELFRAKGYRNTSMSEIGTACGLLKGSIYHYFPSKAAIGIAVLQEVSGRFRNQVLEAGREGGYEGLLEATERFFTQRKGGCVIHNLALDAATEPQFEPAIRAFIRGWCGELERVLDGPLESGQAREKAREVVMRVMGAVMLDEIHGRHEWVRSALRQSRLASG